MSLYAGKKVLLIDDSGMIRKILRKLLEEAGITETDITDCENGTQAQAAIDAGEFSIILCDLNMPDMSGMEVLSYAKNIPERNSTPFVMITSELSNEVVDKARSLGVADFIGKPFSKAVFERKVLGLLI